MSAHMKCKIITNCDGVSTMKIVFVLGMDYIYVDIFVALFVNKW